LGDNTSTYYSYYNHPGYLNDYNKFYSPYKAPLATLAHFNNPAPQSAYVVYNDGIVIESGYDRTSSHKWFIYTTMKSPLDGEHPVSGNRRFGIMPDAINGGYTFYIRGVDRTTDNFTTVMNWSLGVVFTGADNLWRSELKGIKNYISQHGGSADYYPNGGVITKRPNWSGPVGQFLKGQISSQQLKNALQCP
jgi:hypothetical protein